MYAAVVNGLDEYLCILLLFFKLFNLLDLIVFYVVVWESSAWPV